MYLTWKVCLLCITDKWSSHTLITFRISWVELTMLNCSRRDRECLFIPWPRKDQLSLCLRSLWSGNKRQWARLWSRTDPFWNPGCSIYCLSLAMWRLDFCLPICGMELSFLFHRVVARVFTKYMHLPKAVIYGTASLLVLVLMRKPALYSNVL